MQELYILVNVILLFGGGWILKNKHYALKFMISLAYIPGTRTAHAAHTF